MDSYKKIGTIIHGAIGDCYEQLCAIRILRSRRKAQDEKWVAFFAVESRLQAMQHFKLDMIDEIYDIDKIRFIKIDEFFQFQLFDSELQENVIQKLPHEIRLKFNLKLNIKPWHIIRLYEYNKSGLTLELSDLGKRHYITSLEENKIDEGVFKKFFTVGFLWRYRSQGGAINNWFQRSPSWIVKTKTELFNMLINNYNTYIFIAGMNKKSEMIRKNKDLYEKGGAVEGEYRAKYTEMTLDLPADRCTYLKGVGYASEMEIMSQCDLLLMMPSGFSEALWMKRKNPVILLDAPPMYVAKLWWNRMPLFDNSDATFAVYNTFVPHTPKNVLRFLRTKCIIQNGIIKKCIKK